MHILFAYKWQQPFLNQRKEQNDCRNYFTITLHESMGRDRDQTRDPGSAGKLATDCATCPGFLCDLISPTMTALQWLVIVVFSSVADPEGVQVIRLNHPLCPSFLNILWKWNNLVSARPKGIFKRNEKISKPNPPHIYTYEPPFQKSWIRPCSGQSFVFKHFWAQHTLLSTACTCMRRLLCH